MRNQNHEKTISECGAKKEEYLESWGYIVNSDEAIEAWIAKLNHDEKVAGISSPNRPHGKLYDLPSYQSPITGKWIDGRVARRNDLAASNCVEYDPGMRTEQAKRIACEDAQMDKKIDEHVEREIYSMPTEKREKLAVELEHNDVAVTRI